MMPANAPRTKHVPLRRCVVCRQSRPQPELLRFYRDAAGAWQFDRERRAGGRGAWLCADKAACRQRKPLGRFFRAQAENVAQQLVEYTQDQEHTIPVREG